MTDKPPLPLPHPDDLDLSDDQIRRFQQLLEDQSGQEISFEDAKAQGLELLRLVLMLLDPPAYAERLKEAPVLNRDLVSPAVPQVLPPVSQPESLDTKLEQLHQSLSLARRRPTQWRWVVVSLWSALAEVLAAHRPAGTELAARPGDLPRLFRTVVSEHPELPQVERSIEMLDQLRTRWLPVGVTRWPVRQTALPGIVLDCLRVIQRLEPDVPCAGFETLLASGPSKPMTAERGSN